MKTPKSSRFRQLNSCVIMAKPRFIVDESIDFPVVKYLRNKGFDTTSVVEDYRSLEDIKILKIAFEEDRILLTNDKDFGNLIFKEKLKSKGLILFRLWEQSSNTKILVLDRMIEYYKNRLSGNFIEIGRAHV